MVEIAADAPVIERSYQCVLIDGTWHLTQEQAAPPPITSGGAWTACGPWAEFKRGYERRRPTCVACLKQVELFEARHGAVEEAGADRSPRRKTKGGG